MSHNLPEITGVGENAKVSLREYLEAIRLGDMLMAEERDRRYAEVSLEREKALKIKETADERALKLASEIQAYKDEKANELRSQIESERGKYMTHSEFEVAHAPVLEYVISQRGLNTKRIFEIPVLIQITSVLVSIAAIIFVLLKK
jgi:hypothetical protein